MNDNPTYLICVPQNELKDMNQVIPGGEEGSCQKCKIAVYISPSGLSLIREQKAKLLCSICGLKQVINDPKPFQITVEQLCEIQVHAPDVFERLVSPLDKYQKN